MCFPDIPDTPPPVKPPPKPEATAEKVAKKKLDDEPEMLSISALRITNPVVGE